MLSEEDDDDEYVEGRTIGGSKLDVMSNRCCATDAIVFISRFSEIYSLNPIVPVLVYEYDSNSYTLRL